MPKFSQQSAQYLAQCHPDLQLLFNTVVRTFDCTVVCGHRDEWGQTVAFAQGKSKLKRPESKHNKMPAMAVDVVTYPINWNDHNRMRYFAGYVIGIANVLYDMEAISHRVRWGGDWNSDTELSDNKFNDLPHFELI